MVQIGAFDNIAPIIRWIRVGNQTLNFINQTFAQTSAKMTLVPMALALMSNVNIVGQAVFYKLIFDRSMLKYVYG